MKKTMLCVYIKFDEKDAVWYPLAPTSEQVKKYDLEKWQRKYPDAQVKVCEFGEGNEKIQWKPSG